MNTSPVSCKGRDNSHFTVCFTKYTLQLCRCTPGVQTTVFRFSNSKACFTWIKKDVIYGGIWPSPYFQQATVKEIIQGNSYFTLHFDETECSNEKAYGLISVLLVRGIKGNKSEVFSINNAWACQGRYSGT